MKKSKPIKTPTVMQGVIVMVVSTLAVLAGIGVLSDYFDEKSGTGIVESILDVNIGTDFDSGGYRSVPASEYKFGDGGFDASELNKEYEYAQEDWFKEMRVEERAEYIAKTTPVTVDQFFTLDTSDDVSVELIVVEFGLVQAWVDGNKVQSEDYYLIGTDTAGADWYIEVSRYTGDPAPTWWKKGDTITVYGGFAGEKGIYDDDWNQVAKYPSMWGKYVEAR